jgi:hypothetical protein
MNGLKYIHAIPGLTFTLFCQKQSRFFLTSTLNPRQQAPSQIEVDSVIVIPDETIMFVMKISPSIQR